MRVVFMGTPAFAVPTLEALAEAGHSILCVVTQPDKPAGRGHKLTPSPVKAASLGRGLHVVQPDRVRDPSFVRAMRELAPDVAVVAAFGQKITAELLKVPVHGFVNVHPSLLPLYRGAAPVERCLMNGDSMTGVTVMYMDEGWDTGDIGICEQFPIPDDPGADAEWLRESLSRMGAELMVRFLRLVEEGQAPRTPQDHSQASYAPKISIEELGIDWRRSAIQLSNTSRGLSPEPGARTSLDGQLLRVLRLRQLELKPAQELEPGTILLGPGDRVAVACGAEGRERAVLEEVQPPGKRRMSGAVFVRGRRVLSGARLI